jgi:hypothetical protein
MGVLRLVLFVLLCGLAALSGGILALLLVVAGAEETRQRERKPTVRRHGHGLQSAAGAWKVKP